MVLGFSRKKISVKKTVGEKLRLARKRQGYNLLMVEKETKVSLKYLTYLEQGKYNRLPPAPEIWLLSFGIIKNS